MNGTLFGIGPMELFMIAVLILLVFGPERVPGLMRDLGHNMRKLRQYYVAFSTELKREMEPFQEDIKGIQDAAKGLQEDLNAIRQAADIRGIITAESLEPAMQGPAIQGPTLQVPTILVPAQQTAVQMIAPPMRMTTPANGNGTVVAVVTAPAASAPVAVAAPAMAALPAAIPAPAIQAEPAAAPSIVTQDVAGVVLGDDNPWAQSAHMPRSDKLDDDNPWAS